HRPIPFLDGRERIDRPQVGVRRELVSGRGRPSWLRRHVLGLLEGRLRLEVLLRHGESEGLAACVRGFEGVLADDDLTAEQPTEPEFLAAQGVKQAQCVIPGQVATEVGQGALDRRSLRWARRRAGARWRTAAGSTRTARAARSRSRTASRWRLLSGRGRLPLRVLRLRANQVEDLVDELN